MEIEKEVEGYLSLFELTRKTDRALILLTELLAAYRREKERADKLHTAIILTLEENGHLADGDNCTLKALKDAAGIG